MSNPSILSRIRGSSGENNYARVCTPLRPNDGMIGRIPSPPKQAEQPESAPNSSRKSHTELVHETAPSTSGPSTPRALTSNEDPFSVREKAVVAEINKMREDPPSYGHLIVGKVRLSYPFVVSGSKTYAQLVTMSEELTARHAEVQEALEMLEDAQQKEIQTHRDQWAIEDAEKMKKGKKAPAPKKGKTDAPVVEEVDPEVARKAIVDEIDARNEEQRQELKASIVEVKDLLDRANQGIHIVDQCQQKLASCKPLKHLEYSRGLSLAARDSASEAELSDPAQFCELYGTLSGPIGFVTHVGDGSVQQNVMEMLLCLKEKGKKGRQLLTDPTTQLIGTGWRRSTEGPRTCCILSSSFEELEAITSREHLPLQDVRRILPLAKQLTSRSVLQVRGDSARYVAPTSHPVVCGNMYTIVMECAPTVQLCASLSLLVDPEPTAPTFFSGEIFVHKCADPSMTEIKVILPHAGHFRVTIFAREEENLAGFQKISSLRLHADNWAVDKKWPSFPTTSSDFHDRNCCLMSPLLGLLEPEQEYTFTISIPASSYLSHELARISASLEKACAQANGSKEAAAALQQSFDEAEERLNAANLAKEEATAATQQEIAALTKDMAKKRGKDLEKMKSQVSELEEQLAQLDGDVETAAAAVEQARERIVQHRRSIRQASAQRRRYTNEKAQVVAASDRSQALKVELSMEERRTQLLPENEECTVYSRAVKVPRSGTISLFIAGLAALTWEIGLP